MAIVAPGVSYRQLSGKSRTPLNHRFINHHTMAGYLNGSEAHFSGSGSPYSHFGLGASGEVRQWQDLQFRAASDLEGNPYSISWETEDHGAVFGSWSGSNVPEWTDAQINALVNIDIWLCDRFDIPPVLVASSYPIPHGLSYHRLGIDPWRVSGGLRYSSSYGKVCPGDRRILQLRNIVVPRVQRRVAGAPVVTPEEVMEMPYPVIQVPNNDPGYPGREKWLALIPGGAVHVPSTEWYAVGVATKLLDDVKTVNARQYDVAADMARRLVPDKIRELEMRIVAIQNAVVS